MGTAVCVCLAPAQASSLLGSLTTLSSSQRAFQLGCSPAFLLTRGPSNAVQTCRKTSSPLCIRSDSNGSLNDKTPFGYTRKDVLLIGLGLTVTGVGLKYGLEFFGVDSLRAGNVVQLVMVLGLTVGWISTYVFRVSTKEMTYAKQLRDYESKVIQKRLEELPEAELESLLAQVEEEKEQLRERRAKIGKSD